MRRWIRIWRWLRLHLRDVPEKQYHMDESPIERRGMSPVYVWAACPECGDKRLYRHKCWGSFPKGDLMVCSKEPKHYWVRSDERRGREREQAGNR